MRLTSKLRSDHPDASTVEASDVLYIKAGDILRERVGRSPPRSSSVLAKHIFGQDHARALSKRDKALTDVFLSSVVHLLGNDALGSVIAQEVAARIWDRMEVAAEYAVEMGLLEEVRRARDDLKARCGDIHRGDPEVGERDAPGPSTPRQAVRARPSSVVSSICGVDVPCWSFAKDTVTQLGQGSMIDKPSGEIITEQNEAEALQEAFGLKELRPNQDVSASWLVEWVRKATNMGLSTRECEDIGTRVGLLVLDGGMSDDALAAELFDLMGESVFEHAEMLIIQRENLRRNLSSCIDELIKESSMDEDGDKAAPVYGTRFSIMSESERLALKQERKFQRKSRGKKKQHVDGIQGGPQPESRRDYLSRHGVGVLVDFEAEKSDAKNKIILGNGMEFRLGEGHGKQASLPKGTSRNVYKGYEEVTVPATKSDGCAPGEVLVSIDELPDWAQLAFEGYKSLNRIQSRIYPAAFFSNENLLVCAPTGAGKTNIAMTCILREIGQHIEGDEIVDINDFKIIYVAPMKALAAEMTYSFGRRLDPLGLTVRELTGDMQLTKAEMESCQMIITTPEKWDVITRKGGEVSIASKVKLLIIDEVHLLNDDRGSVIETIVARTTRQVETSQSMIRIVGLSATLPNYQDVAQFLGVNARTGLFYFDASYRPVPLQTSFVGVTERSFFQRQATMDEVCYQKVLDSLQRGHQAMVFVHSRKDTGKTGRMLAMKAQQNGETASFDCSNLEKYDLASKDAKKSRNKEMLEVFASGIGIHHAGMLRSDRTMMERFFSQGYIKVLCCTATLAWGVNLPAHTVIIKGTQLYIPQKGGFTDLGMLDVQQIFGRAGRPQFQDMGEASILTSHDKLAHYLGMITHSVPIESKFVEGLADHLNAEVALGTVTNVKEGISWLGYTYLVVRMRKNPLAYGISWEELSMDPDLVDYRRKLITEAARSLDRARMVRFDERSGNIYTAEMGRVASHFYLSKNSIETYNGMLKPYMNEQDVIAMICMSSEFENLNVRDDELPELDTLARGCTFEVKGGSETKHGKASILLQTFVSREKLDSFSLIADLNYISQNAPRIARALFEICMNKGWPSAAEVCLTVSKALEWRLWPSQHPLWQFESFLKPNIIEKIQEYGFDLMQLKEMKADEIGAALRHPSAGSKVLSAIANIPTIDMDATVVPITRTVVRIHLKITPDFKWRDSIHGNSLRWYLWVEDSENERIYHSEIFNLTKSLWREGTQSLAFPIPIKEPLPSQYYVKAVSDSWIDCEATATISFKGIRLPEQFSTHTRLLDLDPLPKSALKNSTYESMYRFSHFNPIQTQAFYQLYHTDENILLGAPTGSGKTISSELTLLRLFSAHKGRKAVFIAPLKALVKERMKDWGQGFAKKLGLRIVEMTGDITPDLRSLLSADIIVTTPEKWDGISRNWQSRAYVRTVGLVIMDEIHLLGADRGPVLEVIVSRMRYISSYTNIDVRFVGLSTALANAADLAGWLGVKDKGLFNFKPSVRPVPLECHIQGYPGKFYCPRMATMNKPSYAAIQTHSPHKPALIFVASRRQTRLTAMDLITSAAADGKPRTFLKMEDCDMDEMIESVQDLSLRHTLQFGVGLHHAGLSEKDRSLVEKLYVGGHIQVLVATSTLAWGVNTPAHLVIVKGTEYYDAPSRRYVDYPITDVLQMMGRAGRPQYDKHGVAVIMVHEPKKSFYKKFLYEPFPVESSLHLQLEDHLNAEIATGTIESTQDGIDYLTWTFFLRRLVQNPTYYGLEQVDQETVSSYLSNLIGSAINRLVEAHCVEIEDAAEDSIQSVRSTFLGQVASTFYLRYDTMRVFERGLKISMEIIDVIQVLCSAKEYEELPVRHNEDNLNAEMIPSLRHPMKIHLADKPSCKAEILIQAHLSRLTLPISDYVTDTRSVLDNSMRILQAMIDVTAERGWWKACKSIMRTVQSIMQARWADENSLMQLPGVTAKISQQIQKKLNVSGLQELIQLSTSKMHSIGSILPQEAMKSINRFPDMNFTALFKRGASKLTIEVKASRRNKIAAKRVPKGFTPCFPKTKEEGWWVAVVDDRDVLLALRRFSMTAGKMTITIPLEHSAELSRIMHENKVPSIHLVSDCYIGLDVDLDNVPFVDA
jgi:activating signal cointegrator complex subunit 3